MSEPNTPKPDSRDERIGRILNDFHDRRARGDPVTVEGLLADHPDLADDLKPYLEMLGDLRSEGDRIQRLVADGVLRESDDPAYQATLGDYKTVGFLGRGGMGIVLKAYEESLGRTVALKILRPELADDKASLQRFTREAKAAGMLRHPNIVTVHAVGEQHGINYIAMEYIEGPTLADLIHEQAPLPTETIRGLFGEVLLGLAAAHESGIIHRDIKSANMLLDGGVVKPIRAGFCEAGAARDVNKASAARDVNEAGGADTPASGTGPTRPGSDSIFNLRLSSFRLKIADFGLALMAATQTRITLPDSSPGTPEYMSPEQARGDEDIDHRADLYSAGIVLYEMLTGRTPFRADTPSVVIHRILLEDPADPRTLNENADPHLASLAMRLMAKRPEDRFASTREAIEALAHRERVRSPEARRQIRRRIKRIAAIVVLLASGVFAITRAWRMPEIVDARIDLDDSQKIQVRFGNSSEWVGLPGFELEVGEIDKVDVVQTGRRGRSFVVAGFTKSKEGKCLFMFDAAGEDIKSWGLSCDLKWPDCESPTEWRCYDFITGDVDGRDGDEIVVVAGDCDGYGTRISVIDLQTRQVTQTFWHMGHLGDLRIEKNFFAQGHHAILAKGLNNKLDGFTDNPEYLSTPIAHWTNVPVVMILDPLDMNGLGPPYVADLGFDRAMPHAYAFLDLPHSDDAQPVLNEEGHLPDWPLDTYVELKQFESETRQVQDATGPWFSISLGHNLKGRSTQFRVDRNLDFVQAIRGLTGTADEADSHWEPFWEPIIQDGKYVDE